ncbi:MAG: hypothetical protein ACK5OX_16525 [Desertimonas sp.]
MTISTSHEIGDRRSTATDGAVLTGARVAQIVVACPSERRTERPVLAENASLGYLDGINPTDQEGHHMNNMTTDTAKTTVQPYAAGQLVRFGEVAELTLGGAGCQPDCWTKSRPLQQLR